MTDFALARRNMVDSQLRPNRVNSAALLAVVGELPRERFLPVGLQAVAYADDDIPLGNGRFMMEPMVLARLIQSLQPRPEDVAMVVGSSVGYGAAILSRLVQKVIAVESDTHLAAIAQRTLRELAVTDIDHVTADLEHGAPGSGPYNVILIEGAIEVIPPAIFDQLAEGGRLATAVVSSGGPRGVAHLSVKEGGVVSGRPLFDVGTQLLPGFVAAPRFAF